MNHKNAISQGIGIFCLALSTPLFAAETIVEVTLETLQRQLDEHPIESLSVVDQAATEHVVLLRADLGASEAASPSITIIMRELERDPPRTKVRVLTDTPVDARQENKIVEAIRRVTLLE